MNYVTGNYDVTGTCLQGKINTSYDRLVELFGKPTQLEADGKVQVEWVMKFTDGTLATIYDWKENQIPEGVTEWHVGGHTQHALYNVIDEVI
jgi:hypothetical protein